MGLELYSVRTELMNDLMGTVRRVAQMGYEVVEFYSPYFQWTPQIAADVRKLMDDVGVKCHSTHNNQAAFAGDGLQKAIDLNRAIGSKYIVMASPPQISGADGWKALGEQLTAAAEKLKPLGMSTGYHNHATEWPQLANGKRAMDVLAASTSKDVVLQLDVGTCVQSGADPVAWINANPGRIRSIHCKDWGAGADRGYTVAFGEGDSPWLKIFEAAEKSGGVEYYLIEQEQSPQGQQFQMAERCLTNYRKLRGN
ncbi:MAG TPA: sugar phosphate isomerase/epimerase [Terriglobia bacterium]|nr:sugar phosphate isomerase/epimerase [Terriglobia bacterium]